MDNSLLCVCVCKIITHISFIYFAKQIHTLAKLYRKKISTYLFKERSPTGKTFSNK